MMTPVVVGLSYRSASLALREPLAVPSRELPVVLRQLREGFALPSIVVLSTCNRVECYAAGADPSLLAAALMEWFVHRASTRAASLRPHLYVKQGAEAAAHLCRVAAGLDSMVLGESEITAQVKQAYQTALQAGTTDPTLNRLFQKALHAAKLVRATTGIADGHASIGAAVVELAVRMFPGRLASCDVLLWGAGKAAEATGRHLMKAGIRQLWVVNRTEPKAQDLAQLCRGESLSWEQALRHVGHVDIAVICTQAPHYVLDTGDLDAVAAKRQGQPLCVIDLSVPRNVDPAVAVRPGVRLYNVDDLQTMTQEAQARRRHEQARGEALIAQQVDYLAQRWQSLSEEEVQCRTVEIGS